ncbi:hypothetical protein QMK33_22885 [Hymenobacter sp. H14-R3]|uniref:hypothetical protein n=1 Tax=Hymenobacter sp. H14-R3 TaxID=3046308 RepID=UPI0024BBB2FD|nr:hypothetical protein [Hymenobacter sp. H14-R3]MDJ0367998.1 hypothetical protein [Hymenobacter sp. H14-R3]
MRYVNALLVGVLAALSVQCTAEPSPSASKHYQVKLNAELWAAVHTYTRLAHLPKQHAAVTLSWTGVYDGTVIYLSSTQTHPERVGTYPVFWTYADSTLVFVYDSKYPHLLADSLGLKQEIDAAIRTTNVALARTGNYVEDPLPLRFITSHGQQRIDTSRLYVKMCQ